MYWHKMSMLIEILVASEVGLITKLILLKKLFTLFKYYAH